VSGAEGGPRASDAERLRKTERLLELRNEQLLEFQRLYGCDVKTMIRTMILYSGFLLEDYADKLDEEGVAFLRKLRRTAMQLKEAITAALHLSFIVDCVEAKKRIVTHSLLQQVTQRVAAQHPHASFRVAKEAPDVRGVSWQVSELFEELLVNATVYNDSAPPIVEIGWTESTPGEDSRVRFFVKDNGTGIEKRYFERIFAMFERLDFQRSPDSLGAGLALCRRIVECHGGRMWVESEPGEGSTFWFTLPCADVPEGAAGIPGT